jgi:hypothetical protein
MTMLNGMCIAPSMYCNVNILRGGVAEQAQAAGDSLVALGDWQLTCHVTPITSTVSD